MESNLLKETTSHIFSCEICEIFQKRVFWTSKLYFFVKENWICVVTRHYTVPNINILLKRNLHIEPDIKQWRHTLTLERLGWQFEPPPHLLFFQKWVFWREGRGGSRAAATPKMEHFAIIVNGFQQYSNYSKNHMRVTRTLYLHSFLYYNTSSKWLHHQKLYELPTIFQCILMSQSILSSKIAIC